MTVKNLLTRVQNKIVDLRKRRRFAASLRHLHGPTELDAGPSEVILIALVRNGSYYLDAFFDYYRGLGVDHFVFFDNGSTDDTIDRIRAERGTIIDQSLLPLAQFESCMREYSAQTYGKNRWCLYVDMDEVLDFEGAARIGIDGLVRYLERGGYSAMVCQMLEMFPKAPLSDVADMPFKEALDRFRYYDLSKVERCSYHAQEIEFAALMSSNTLGSEEIAFYFGGVRGKVFGENCCLTKHPLFFNGPDVRPGIHPHVSMGLHCADVTGVLKHYKFTNDTITRDTQSHSKRDLRHGEDAARLAILGQKPGVTLYSGDAQRWDGIDPLYEQGFLVRSDAFTRFVEGREA